MTLSAAAKDIDERYVVVGIKTKKKKKKKKSRKKEGKYQKIPRGGQVGIEKKYKNK